MNNIPYSPAAAAALQRILATRLVLKGDLEHCDLIAGADASFRVEAGIMVGAVVVWRKSSREIVDEAFAAAEPQFPYISGLLAFRELPVMIAAFSRLRTNPDALIVDGQGYAHPRRMGIACHVGLELNLPTVGCAKSRLVGRYDEPAQAKGSRSILWADEGDDSVEIGRVVRTKYAVSPVFISPGNLCGMEEAVKLVLDCTIRFRLPEPVRAAHSLSKKLSSLHIKRYE